MAFEAKVKTLRNSSSNSPSDRLAKAKELEKMLDRSAELAHQLSVQHLVCTGHILRQGVWQRVSRLNKPLNRDERNYIRRIKRKSSSILFPISDL